MRRVFALLLLVACDEEAVVHPPVPPTMPSGDLSGQAGKPSSMPASQPAAAAAVAAAAATGQVEAQAKPSADLIPKSKMSLETLMEDYLEPLAKKAAKSKQRSPELDDLLGQVAKMMPEDPRFAVTNPAKSWEGIVDNALKAQPPKYTQSCKQCHTLWKKPYKKAFHKREIEVVLPASD